MSAKIDELISEVRQLRATMEKSQSPKMVLDATEAARFMGCESQAAFSALKKRLKRAAPIKGAYPIPMLNEWLAQMGRLRPKG